MRLGCRLTRHLLSDRDLDILMVDFDGLNQGKMLRKVLVWLSIG